MEGYFRKKKSLGQNFLKSRGAVKNIVISGDIKDGDMVLEIGPGKGVLTEALLATPAKVIAVEKDNRLIPVLEKKFEKEIQEKKLILLHGDILETPIEDIIKGGEYKVIANIPYYITGALFRLFLENENPPSRMVVLVQKEVAQRIVAKDKKESLLSLSIKAYGKPKIIDKVSKKMFSPQPKVDSAILLVSDINKSFFSTQNRSVSDEQSLSEQEFFKLLRAGFSQKRKKLIRNLEAVAQKENLERIFLENKLDPNSRAEDLSLEQWRNLYNVTRKT